MGGVPSSKEKDKAPAKKQGGAAKVFAKTFGVELENPDRDPKIPTTMSCVCS